MKIAGCAARLKTWAQKYSFGPLFSDANPVAERLTSEQLSDAWLAPEARHGLTDLATVNPDYCITIPSTKINWNELLFGGLAKKTYQGEHRRIVQPRHSLALRTQIGQTVFRPDVPATTNLLSAETWRNRANNVAAVILNTLNIQVIPLETAQPMRQAEAELLASVGTEMQEPTIHPQYDSRQNSVTAPV